MAKPKSVAAPMKMNEIDLGQETKGVVEAVKEATNILILGHALDKETKGGKRMAVVEALSSRIGELRSQGPGSESPPDPFEDAIQPQETAWDTFDATKPKIVPEHNQGKGSESKQNLTNEQRLMGELRIEAQKHRINDVKTLTTPIEIKANGAKIYVWGNIMPPQKEIKAPDGKIEVPYRPSIIYLKTCPNCGKPNHPDQSTYGQCNWCKFDVVEKLVKPYLAKFPGVELG